MVIATGQKSQHGVGDGNTGDKVQNNLFKRRHLECKQSTNMKQHPARAEQHSICVQHCAKVFFARFFITAR